MVLCDYFQRIGEAIEFLIALGSVVGFMGLILGLIFLLFPIGGDRSRITMLGIVIVSIILIALCGLHTGTKYFHLH
ncbi:MAG: hypothetical protein EU539_01790 [Promethearchaeota archaeon]|nr:MAG: hypothetical protein EU539_01790 [Candidatus Lokiarchaeota archaeon]